MPQIEKITYITTIYWVFISYFVLYLDLIVTYLYKFLTSLKFDLKRLSLILTKALRRNLDQNILRQWSKEPTSSMILLLTLTEFLREDKKKHVNPYPRPPERDSVWGYLCHADEWLQYWAAAFSEDQWTSSLITTFFLLPTLTIGYYRYALWLGYPGVWLKWWQRGIFYSLDLFLNVIFGPISLISKDSALCALVTKCPVVLSPVFLLVELIVFVYYMYLLQHISGLTDSTTEAKRILVGTVISWFFNGLIPLVLLQVAIYFLSWALYKVEATTYILIVIVGLVQISFFAILLKYIYIIKTGQWTEFSKLWKKKAEKQDNILVGNKHFVRNEHKKNDLERELARKPSFFERISLPFYKIFNIKTKRERQTIELKEIKENKPTNNKKSLWAKFKSQLYDKFGKHYNKVMNPFFDWMAKKIFKD